MLRNAPDDQGRFYLRTANEQIGSFHADQLPERGWPVVPRGKRRTNQKPVPPLGQDFEPYITVRDVSSKGVSTRSAHPKISGMAQELSSIETSFRLILEWSDVVRNIKEQVALDLDETLQIAEDLGIEHPAVDHDPKVMTSDFVIEMLNEGITVVQIKSWAFTIRDVEKMEIERRYWLRRKAKWMLVTDLQIPDTLVSNVRSLRKYVDLADYRIADRQVTRIRRVAEPLIVKDIPLNDIGELVDERLGFDYGTSLTVFRHLIATKEWLVDMFQPINPGSRLNILSLSRHPMSEEASTK